MGNVPIRAVDAQYPQPPGRRRPPRSRCGRVRGYDAGFNEGYARATIYGCSVERERLVGILQLIDDSERLGDRAALDAVYVRVLDLLGSGDDR